MVAPGRRHFVFVRERFTSQAKAGRTMITVDEALERILGYVEVLEPEERPLLEALGQVLAEDVTSAIEIPPLDNTAMDGYAVRAEDTRGASPDSPVEVQVVGEVAVSGLFELTASVESFLGVLSEGLQQPVADRGTLLFGEDERFACGDGGGGGAFSAELGFTAAAFFG